MIRKLFKIVIYVFIFCALVVAIGVNFPNSAFPNVGFKDNIYIRNINVVDTVSGNIVPGQNILIRDGIIENISTRNIRPVDELIIIVDGEGKYLIPGLWDMHYASQKRAEYTQHPLLLANGVMHVRDLSGCLNQNDPYWACAADRDRWNRLANEDSTYSPYYHQQTALPIDAGLNLPEDYANNLQGTDSNQVEAIIDLASFQELDFLTATANLSQNSYLTLARLLNNSNMYLAGEKPNSVTLLNSLAMRHKSYDHSSLFAEECSSTVGRLRSIRPASSLQSTSQRRQLLSNQNTVQCKALMTAMASSDSWWTPSLVSLKSQANSFDAAFRKSENRRFASLVQRYLHWYLDLKNSPFGPDVGSANVHKEFYQRVQTHAADANQAGVRMLTGSNASTPYVYSGFSVHDELVALTEAGLSPLQALRTATLNPATFSGVSNQFGSIYTRMHADMIVLNANPLEDIRNTRNIDSVINRSTYYDRAALDKIFAFSEAQAKNWHMNIKIFWDSISSPLMRHELKTHYQQAKERE
ncbi:MAG: amidohydrolase family protein [Gammaproteobacteria bacterium]|nr:amidohydrolase family protein [Gammaproteobacteria bacterium]NNM14520.1 amidohydrolase family protein [Gammaproteobacteria bacterium]